MTSLSQKSINNSLTRANSAEIAGFAMPSNYFFDLSVSDWNTFQEAPATGYINVAKSGLQNLGIVVSTSTSDDDTIYNTCIVDNAYDGFNKGMIIPIKKGMYFKVYGNSSGVFYQFRFIYAEGEL